MRRENIGLLAAKSLANRFVTLVTDRLTPSSFGFVSSPLATLPRRPEKTDRLSMFRHPVDEAQLLSHLRLLCLQVGLLINFHVVLLRDGIRWMVNDYREEEPEAAKFAENNRKER